MPGMNPMVAAAVISAVGGIGSQVLQGGPAGQATIQPQQLGGPDPSRILAMIAALQQQQQQQQAEQQQRLAQLLQASQMGGNVPPVPFGTGFG